MTDAELDAISRDVDRFTGDPHDRDREAEAARHLPRLVAEVRRLREVEKGCLAIRDERLASLTLDTID